MDKLDHLGWVASRTYEVGNIIFGVRTTSERFAGWLDESLDAYRSDEEVDPYFSVVAPEADAEKPRSVREFNVLFRDATSVVRTLHLPTMTKLFISEISTFLYPERDDAIYAAVVPVSSNGSVAVMPSPYVEYVGDLGRKVRRAGVSLPAVSAVTIDPGSGLVSPPPPLQELPDDAFDRLEELFPSTSPPDRLDIDDPIEPTVVLTRGQGQMLLEPISPARALHALTGSVLNLEKIGGSALVGLARLVENIPCYALGGGAQEMLDGVKNALRSA